MDKFFNVDGVYIRIEQIKYVIDCNIYSSIATDAMISNAMNNYKVISRHSHPLCYVVLEDGTFIASKNRAETLMAKIEQFCSCEPKKKSHKQPCKQDTGLKNNRTNKNGNFREFLKN